MTWNPLVLILEKVGKLTSVLVNGSLLLSSTDVSSPGLSLPLVLSLPLCLLLLSLMYIP